MFLIEPNINPEAIVSDFSKPQKALLFLEQYLLGEDYCIVNPMTNIQANSEVVHDILYKYSKKYRKEFKNNIQHYRMKLNN